MNFFTAFFIPGLLVALAEVFHALFYFFLFLWGVQTLSQIVCKVLKYWLDIRLQYLLKVSDSLLQEDVLKQEPVSTAVHMPATVKGGK